MIDDRSLVARLLNLSIPVLATLAPPFWIARGQLCTVEPIAGTAAIAPLGAAGGKTPEPAVAGVDYFGEREPVHRYMPQARKARTKDDPTAPPMAMHPITSAASMSPSPSLVPATGRV
jgi:hypothetical protein